MALVKEVKLHQALNTHVNVLEFIGSKFVDPASEEGSRFYPGAYLLLEYAANGDLFDKIGTSALFSEAADVSLAPVPDVGLNEDLSHLYFMQLVSGMVSFCFITSPSSLWTGLHSLKRDLSSVRLIDSSLHATYSSSQRSQTGEHPARRKWYTKDIRSRPCGNIQL
jgi:hypothetical protein